MKYISLILVLIAPACVTQQDPTVAGDQFQLDQGERYTLANAIQPTSRQLHVGVWDGGAVRSCKDSYGRGDVVVRKWYLKERNARDFRQSRTFCKNMTDSGTLGSNADQPWHFDYAGSGTTGTSYISTSNLPVGVQLRGSKDILGVIRIADVAMLYDRAGDIYAGYTGYNRASYALGRNGRTWTLQCDPG